MLKNQLSELTDNILQQALQAEYKAFYLYRHLSIQCQRLGLFGAAKFFDKESTDEQSHAKRIEDYFNDRGTVV
jgi:ferritin